MQIPLLAQALLPEDIPSLRERGQTRFHVEDCHWYPREVPPLRALVIQARVLKENNFDTR